MEELRKISKKYYLRQVVACWLVLYMSFGMPVQIAMANPNPGADAHPSTGAGGYTATLGGTAGTAGNTTIITAPNGSIFYWNNFDIGSNHTVNVLQGINDATLSKVNAVDGMATGIFGHLHADGTFMLIAPRGLIFGADAYVSARNFVGSSLDISDADFTDGIYQFSGGGIGEVANYGEISAEQVALIGRKVLNAGVIRSPNGYVLMAAGDRVFLGTEGSSVVVEVDAVTVPQNSPIDGIGDVINEGTIEAAGGTIVLAAGDTFSRAINGLDSLSLAVSGGTGRVGQFGTIVADGADSDGGSITLSAGEVVSLSSKSVTTANAGNNGDGGEITIYSPEAALFWDGAIIEAKGGSESGNGGFVEISGKEYLWFKGQVDTSATIGGNGSLLIDPLTLEVKVSGASIPNWSDHLDGFYYDSLEQTILDPADIVSQLSLQNVLLLATDLITVTDALNYNIGNDLKLQTEGAAGGILVNNTITNAGAGNIIFDSGTGNIDIESIVQTGGSIVLRDPVSIGADITAGALIVLHDDTKVNGDRKLEAGYDVFLAADKMLTGDSSLTVKAKNNVNLGGATSAVGSLILNADSDGDGAGTLRAKSILEAGGSVVLQSKAIVEGDVTAGALIVMHDDTQAYGDRKLEAGYDVFLAADKTLTGDSSLTVNAKNNVNLGGATSAVGNLILNADSDGDGTGMLRAKSVLEAGGSVVLQSKAIVEGDVTAGALIVLHDDTQAYGDRKLEAGYDVFLAADKMLTGDSSLTVKAKNNINLGGATSAVGSLILNADSDGDGAGTLWAKDTLSSNNGSIVISASDSTIYLFGDVIAEGDITLFANTWFKGFGDQTVEAETGTLTANGWLKKWWSGDLWLIGGSDGLAIDLKETTSTHKGNLWIIGKGDVQIGGDLTTFGEGCCGAGTLCSGWPTGGVAIVSITGKIYTEDGVNDDTLNVSVTGNSDHLAGLGVGDPFGDDTKVAIAIMSTEDLKIGSAAELRAYGRYYDDVDDQAAINFLTIMGTHIPVGTPRKTGEPFDMAIYAGSIGGNVDVSSPVSIMSQEGEQIEIREVENCVPKGTMVIDSSDTVTFDGGVPGGLFETSLAAGDVGDRLEVVSRRSEWLQDAVGRLPYALGGGPFLSGYNYVLRGAGADNPAIGSGAPAWVLELLNTEPAPLPEAETELAEQREFAEGGCPALMAWLAEEIGIPAEQIRVYIGNMFAYSTDIQPCEACARLKDTSLILEDAEGARIAALGRVVSEFAATAAPPSAEQMALITSAFAAHRRDGTYYASAGEWIDALAEYVGIMSTELEFSARESVVFAEKYVQPIAEAGDASVIGYVQARLSALSGL